MKKNKAAQDLRAIPSDARAQASRENGKKGGRPKKTAQVVELFRTPGGCLWTRCKAKKPGNCFDTGVAYSTGDFIYRPLTNGAFRMKRFINPPARVEVITPAKEKP